MRRVLGRLSLIFFLVPAIFSEALAFQLMLVSQKMEKRIGERSARAIEKQVGTVDNPELLSYLQKVGEKVALFSKEQRDDIAYTFKVLKLKQVNAISVVQTIYITSGMWKKLKTEDELAFVLGHEIAHTALQHQRKSVNRQLIASFLFTLFLPESQIISQGAGILQGILENGWSRSKESQADRFGLRYMVSAGYNPKASLEVMKKLGGEKASHVEKIFLTHPPTPERVEQLKRLIQEHHWSTGKKLVPLPAITLQLPSEKKEEKRTP